MWQIREVNGDDEAEARAYFDLYVRAERDGAPETTVYSWAQTRSALENREAGRTIDTLVAVQAGRLIGAVMTVGSTSDNLHSAWVAVDVAPEHAGRGVGSALLDAAEQRLAAQGRTELTAEVGLNGDRSDRNRRFAEKHGYHWSYSEVERRLQLPIPAGRLDELDAAAAPHRAGYRIEAVDGPIPERWAQGFCDVANRLVLDAPHGDLEVEERRRTPQLLAEQDAELIAAGQRRVSALAIAPDDTVAALTTCMVSDPGEPAVSQWATVVDRDHRGHRLGMSVKVACYRLLARVAPDKAYIQTGNADTNQWMIAINERLGFTVHDTRGVFSKRLTG